VRIVGHIHTFNDEEVIDRSLHALLRQTCPVDEIILVDNGSTDGTLVFFLC
jgi:glycosyltransferase involved in cell wall biosynthesis